MQLLGRMRRSRAEFALHQSNETLSLVVHRYPGFMDVGGTRSCSQARPLAGLVRTSGMSISARYKKVTAAGTQTFDPALNATQGIIYGWIEVTTPAVSSAESYLHFLDFFP